MFFSLKNMVLAEWFHPNVFYPASVSIIESYNCLKLF